MALVLPHDIICGGDFTGQNVDCSPPNNYFKAYLTLFINTSVNDLLLGNAARLGFQSPIVNVADRVCRLKQESFKICLNVDYYTRFQAYMNQAMTVGGVSFFNLDYIPLLQQPSITVDGSIIDCKILHLFISGLTIFLASSAGWLDIKQVLEYIETGRSRIYMNILPMDRLIPPGITQALFRVQPPSYKDIRSIQKLYTMVAYNFFTYGGAIDVPALLGRNVGITRTYRANTTTVVPPSQNQIVWNNADQSLSTNIHLSSYDETNTDIGFLLEDGVQHGRLIIRHQDNPAVVFQEWAINNVSSVADQYVTYQVTPINFTRQAVNNQVCEIVIWKHRQSVPDQTDYQRRRFLDSARNIGGRKKRQNKSRNKQKNSNKKFRFSKRRYSRRRRMF